jgi:hypothetical protein
MSENTAAHMRALERRKNMIPDYLRGMSQYDLAAKYGVNQSLISRELKRIRQDWEKSILVDFNQAKARELSKIDNLEKEYWAAWKNSIGEKTKTRTKKIIGASATEASVEKDQMLGNPAWLQGIQWCIEQRCKIFGIYEATKLAVVDWRKAAEDQGLDTGKLFEDLVNKYVEALGGSNGDEDADDGTDSTTD